MLAPTLETEYYFLRAIRVSDAPALFSYASNKQVTQFTQWPVHQSLSETRRFIKQQYHRPQHLVWGIISKESGLLLGQCGVEIDKTIGEIHCTLAPEYWGKGIAHQVLQRIIDYSFVQCGIQTIQGSIIAENNRSIRLAQKLDMQHTGTLEQCWLIGSTLHNVDIYTITRR